MKYTHKIKIELVNTAGGKNSSILGFEETCAVDPSTGIPLNVGWHTKCEGGFFIIRGVISIDKDVITNTYIPESSIIKVIETFEQIPLRPEATD